MLSLSKERQLNGLQVWCPQCGAQADPNARFCSQCGYEFERLPDAIDASMWRENV
jgi:predicted amidophosphoribosyltransferase